MNQIFLDAVGLVKSVREGVAGLIGKGTALEVLFSELWAAVDGDDWTAAESKMMEVRQVITGTKVDVDAIVNSVAGA